MVNRENELEKYGVVIEKVNERKEDEKKGSRTVELFFSFDIVNSSAYKDTDYFGWQIVLPTLLTDIQNYIAKEIPQAQLWRVLGDEIIFFVTIKNVEEIYVSIDSIYDVLINASINLHTGKFFKQFENERKSNSAKFMNGNNVLGLQATAWIAIVKNGTEKDFQMYDNVFKKYIISENQEINEFLGQDIDIGFRIKKETQDRRLAVSIELAKILSEKTEYVSKLNIITYKKLKGVWEDRLYPIIWYYDISMNNGIQFQDSFYYDETSFSELSRAYFDNRENVATYMFTDVPKAINKILTDQKLEAKIERIHQIIDITQSDVKVVENEFKNKLLEFHCAAVCCDVPKKRILIVKRKNRRINTGLWEFGCARADIEHNLCDSVKSDYRNDFGIDIDIICDKNRDNDIQPYPIALYQVNKMDKLHKGVIVVAKVIGNIEKLEETIEIKGKHETYRWITEEEVDSFHEVSVNDFKVTLKRVFELWNELFEEK